MITLDARRQQSALQRLRQAEDLVVGDAAQLPVAPATLQALTPTSPGVEQVCAGGLTAVVYKLRTAAGVLAVKQARPECLVRNLDGQTSFVNELLCHAEIAACRARGADLPGLIAPWYGSLHQGLIVSPWIDGQRPEHFDERSLRQLYGHGRTLCERGLFEWDFSPGNILDDGRQLWLFDFGYMYRYDPLTQFNTAGQGDDVPAFHYAERIETRNLFGWLLRLEQHDGIDAALDAFRLMKTVAHDSFTEFRAHLAARGAAPTVLCWLDSILADWADALRSDLQALYLKEGWRSHQADLDDDLSGQTCTPATLARADWLIDQAAHHAARLRSWGLLHGDAARLDAPALVAQLRGLRQRAEQFQIGASTA